MVLWMLQPSSFCCGREEALWEGGLWAGSPLTFLPYLFLPSTLLALCTAQSYKRAIGEVSVMLSLWLWLPSFPHPHPWSTPSVCLGPEPCTLSFLGP